MRLTEALIATPANIGVVCRSFVTVQLTSVASGTRLPTIRLSKLVRSKQYSESLKSLTGSRQKERKIYCDNQYQEQQQQQKRNNDVHSDSFIITLCCSIPIPALYKCALGALGFSFMFILVNISISGNFAVANCRSNTHKSTDDWPNEYRFCWISIEHSITYGCVNSEEF